MDNIRRLELARDRVVDVYSREVKDEVYDNGLLDMMNFAVRFIEDAIRELKRRSK